ncbi:MAG: putative DNA-binding domain-containing protein, partial [Hyphomicrobiales bacterium]|nr:putative DNA-binding domain-containing protein [Hyphomicrobiales bacterium]
PLHERQRAFADAILNPALAAPAGLLGPDGVASAHRFGVYRNNVVMGLIHLLEDKFPAVLRLVGTPFFQAMAQAFVLSCPPQSPILLQYGGQFPDFIARFTPARELPYLADVARIEQAYLEAYHAEDADALDPSAFLAIAPQDFDRLHLQLHPSVQVLSCTGPALRIWQMNVGDEPLQPVDLGEAQCVLVSRPEALVELREIQGSSEVFISSLLDQASVVTALQRALAADPEFDLSANLAGLLEAQCIVGFGFAPPDVKRNDP